VPKSRRADGRNAGEAVLHYGRIQLSRTEVRVKPKDQSNRAWLILALRDLLAKVGQDERNRLAAELGIVPQFRIVFVKGVDEGENHL
jgi:hypothetical protein